MTTTILATIRRNGQTRLHVTRDDRYPDRTGLVIEDRHGEAAEIKLDAGEVAQLIGAVTDAWRARAFGGVR